MSPRNAGLQVGCAGCGIGGNLRKLLLGKRLLFPASPALQRGSRRTAFHWDDFVTGREMRRLAFSTLSIEISAIHSWLRLR